MFRRGQKGTTGKENSLCKGLDTGGAFEELEIQCARIQDEYKKTNCEAEAGVLGGGILGEAQPS